MKFTRLMGSGVLLLFLILCAPLLRAATYYVSTAGSDSNPGTIDQPFRHLSKAAGIALAGDFVIVRDGRYDNEGVVAPGYVVTLSHSGTPLQPITFMAEHQGGAILDAMNTVTDQRPCDGASAYINLANASYVALRGFVITRACDEGIHNNDGAHNITISRNEIHHIANRSIIDKYGREAIGCSPRGHDILVDGNVIHDIGRINRKFTTSLDHGLYMSCRNLAITNNRFYNQVAGWDIQLADGADDVLIANNVFASRNPSQAGQIVLWGSHANIAIRSNIFYNPPRFAVVDYKAAVVKCRIEANMVSGTAQMYEGTGCSIGPNRMRTDPMFVDAKSHDYRLRTGSPAIFAGIGVTAVAAEGSSMIPGNIRILDNGRAPN